MRCLCMFKSPMTIVVKRHILYGDFLMNPLEVMQVPYVYGSVFTRPIGCHVSGVQDNVSKHTCYIDQTKINTF